MSTIAVRFWAKVAAPDESGCRVWTGCRNQKGYGRISVDGRLWVAHRVAWQIIAGRDLPEGMQLDHLCRNRACVEIAHLEPVTPKENTRRGITGWVNRTKTHCPKGHPYSPDNTFVYADGRRACRECQRAKDRRRYREARGTA